MASGHVNRANRPNTWLLRPSLLREEIPCQPGAVHTWPKAAADILTARRRFRKIADMDRFFIPQRSVANDPKRASPLFDHLVGAH
jgi:hypothetical protein